MNTMENPGKKMTPEQAKAQAEKKALMLFSR